MADLKGQKRENKEYQSVINDFLKLSEKERHKRKPYEDIESDEELMSRFIPFLRKVAVGYLNKKVLVVTYGGVMRAFLHRLDYTLPAGSIGNTAYLVVESDGVDFFIKESFGIKKTESQDF